jgi:hypothetical protein
MVFFLGLSISRLALALGSRSVIRFEIVGYRPEANGVLFFTKSSQST